MMFKRYSIVCLLFCALAMGCGDDGNGGGSSNNTPTEDAGPDATAPDTGGEDTGAEDTGAEDAGAEDAGEEDTGEEDTGPDVSEPCDGACEGATPVCDEANDVCVECLDEGDCTDGVCDTDNVCVECLGDGDCTDGVCDTADNVCVECLADNQCADPAASTCDDSTNTCEPCSSNDHCSHIADAGVCEEGACVECTVDDESACGGNSCDPATNTCTSTPVESVDTCRPCKADSECVADHRCIPMEFNGTDLDDGFCLKTLSSGCQRPYTVQINRESISGEAADDYCGIDESHTTCRAVLDLFDDEQCSIDADCGVDGLSDARCETVGGVPDRCTYSCSTAAECPSTRTCQNTGGQNYCGGI